MKYSISIKDLLVLIIITYLTFAGLVYLDFNGLKIPILRQLIGFTYLSLVPGALILAILEIYNFDLDVLLYSIGVSFSFIMLAGAFINILLPSVGVAKPMSGLPLTISLNILFLLLIITCYLRNKNHLHSEILTINSLNRNNLPWTIYLLLIPFLGIIGSQLLRIYNNNYILLILFLIISSIPLSIAFDKIPKRMYPFAIWVISISLLFQSLASVTSVRETVMPGVVVKSGVWDPLLAYEHSALLADSILAPIFIILCDMDIIWGLRFVASFSFSLIPLMMYQAFRKIGNEKIAFISSFLLVSMYYFSLLPFGIRTGFALLFFSYLLLLIANKKVSSKTCFLSVVFAFSLISCHYGVSYIFMFAIIIASLLSFLSGKLGYHNEPMFLSPTFITLYVVMALIWYMSVGGSHYFNFIVTFVHHVVNELSSFFTLESSHIIESLQMQWTFSIQLIKYFLVVFSFFISFGVLTWLFYFYREKKKIHYEYLFLAMSYFLLLVATALPIGGLGNMRTVLIILTPLFFFCTIGFLSLSKVSKKILKGNNDGKLMAGSIKMFSILAIIFFLLNSGFISEVIIKDYSPNVLIHNRRIMESGDVQAKRILYTLYYMPSQNLNGVEWLENYGVEWKSVYCDRIGIDYVEKTTRYGDIPYRMHRPKAKLLNISENIEKESYILLVYHNIVERIAIVEHYPLSWYNVSESSFNNMNKIYSNGNNVIYYS